MLINGRRAACGRPRQRDQPLRARPVTFARSLSGSATAKSQLLDYFWEARGVLDPAHRKLLVDAAEALDAEALQPLDTAPLAADTPLPGLPATWQLERSAPEVLAASRRLLALQQLLGGGLPAGPASSSAASASAAAAASFGGFAAGPGLGAAAAAAGSGRGIDVVWMVVREPGLLSADLTRLTRRLLDMKLATYGIEVDVLKLVEAQPALLLSDSWRLDLESLQASSPNGNGTSSANGTSAAATHGTRVVAAAAAAGGSGAPPAPAPALSAPAETHASAAGPTASASAGPAAISTTTPGSDPAASTTGNGSGRPGAAAAPQPGGPGGPAATAAGGGPGSASSSAAAAKPDAVQQLVQAWQYGVTSDGDVEWASRLSQLAAYRTRHGDTCVGFRDGDDPELSRWATKQRADRRRGELAPERLDQLTALGFLFDADEAEWCRWFSELLAFKAATGHASPMPLVTGGDMYLINWCSVQRIARRSRVLSDSRVQRLDQAGFDWSGADPLS